jgi:NADH-quinone oxidoreductase subunit L
VNFLDAIWLIPLFPALGAVIVLVGQALPPAKRPKLLVTLLCPGTVLLSFLFSCAAVWQLSQQSERVHQVIQFTWLAGMPFHTAAGSAGGLATFQADWGFLLDPLSAVMILVVTGVGFLIHVYSTGYMAHDGGYYRFFGYLNLFVFFMLMLVLANNYALLFVGWEGVGLCSYLLIGFYFHKKSAGDAGKKAFVVNRVGDAGFILGMLLMLSVLGTVRFTDVNTALGRFRPETAGFGVLSATALLLFIGATGKSAQFPLYVWLPDAMEGPTPVSALIHAATMVTAGVYMVARSSALFRLTPQTATVVAVIGAFTAIFAASIALVQNDIKRVLAYSTVSQLGYMFLALGVGAYWVAVFHLFTHAFFKALLFLCSGSVIHALGGERDMRRMGGLKGKIPITHATMFIGSVAIAGIPGFAGFFSKDEILWQAWQQSRALWTVGFVTAGMTAFYMWRLMNMTFYGKSRVEREREHHIHESPRSMTVPLALLAIGSVLAGWLGTPKLWGLGETFRAFENWLEPSVAPVVYAAGDNVSESTELILMSLSVALALSGIWLARYLYITRPDVPGRIAAAFRPLYTVLYNKWYVDEIYDFLFVNGLGKGGGRVLGAFDRNVVDGGVNGAGWLTRFCSRLSMWWDTWIIDGAVRFSSLVVRALSYPACLLETGRLQSYALGIVLGAAIFLGYYVMR